LVATGGGLGYAPVAPGTVGSLVGVAIFCGMQLIPSPSVRRWLGVVITLGLSLGGVWAASQAQRIFGVEDPPVVVVDEVAGQFVTLWLATALMLHQISFSTAGFVFLLVSGFVLFRLLDIFKPYPIRRLEQLGGGWGIMADDLGAGIIAGLALHILYRWIIL
jgi:phosphatidylglycerophosphatase A